MYAIDRNKDVDQISLFVGRKLDAVLQTHRRVYPLQSPSQYSVFPLQNLKHYVIYPVYEWKAQSIIVLKHLYL